MPPLPPYRRILLLTEGRLGPFTSKTAAAVLRYRAADVMGVVDSAAAGRPLRDFLPAAPDLPIWPDLAAALPARPDALFVGVSPPGGELPAEMRRHVVAALDAGVDVVSGLHDFLALDTELISLAELHQAKLIDLRRPPASRLLASARAGETRCLRILTVGSDGNVGKMFATLELHAAAERRGLRSAFIATGQTGMMISGAGVAVDACVADFAAGAVEALVMEAADRDICFIEGQGSLGHPGFSAVTLALLHGACPDALVLVHHLGRTHYRAAPHVLIPPLRELVSIYEQTAALLHPARIAAVAVNALGLSPSAARRQMRQLERELLLPVFDALQQPDGLLAAVLDAIPRAKSLQSASSGG